ncbi:TonB-dependent receptor [uncultured Chitinophaga sp.]|uniref:TonB-dependent receptor n=1 Tax=uncultured Chitinophaga sp. TaxID=339340 RepID=UPI0025F75CAE|nr:TonB-dependent receptor [uncultured Chitinophaga sp.]
MKHLFKLILLLFPFVAMASEENPDAFGIIKGQVLTSDGEPAPGVTVQVVERKKGEITNVDGQFQIRRLPAGSYTVQISLIGYETLSETVIVEENKTSIVNFRLKASNKELQTVEVTAINKFGNRESKNISRLPIRNLENPQVYSVINKDLLKEQIVTSFDDALKNAPGLNKLWSSTGRGGDGTGYYSLRGFTVQPKVVNGVAGASNGSPDPANIERIEVIKGPSGTLFGSSVTSFGGLINIVTKKPHEGFAAEVSYTGGSYGLNRITADVNTQLDSLGKALFRLNAAYHNEGSWQDAGFKKSFFIAPSLTYKVSDRTTLDLRAEISQSDATNIPSYFLTRNSALKTFTPDEMNIDFSRAWTSNDISMKNPVMNVYGVLTNKLGKSWTSETNVSTSVRKSDGYYIYLSVLPGDTSLGRSISKQDATSTFVDIQQNFIGDFKIGSLRNRVVIGLDYLSNKTNNNNSPYISFDTVNTNRADARYTRLTESAVTARFAGASNSRTISETNTYSAYVSDVLNVTEQLNVMASLRVDYFENKGTYNAATNITPSASKYYQTAFSPKFGAVYEILKNKLSVFGNYMNGFQNVAPATQPDGSVSTFKPQQANQWEAGVKGELLGGRISGSISYYDIYVTNITVPDPNKAAGFTIQDGNISSKGFEAEVTANPVNGLNIIAGYAYNDAINDKTTADIKDRRPVSSGPKHQANAWISYKLGNVNEVLNGLGMGFGGNYGSENIITNNTVTGQFKLPSYVVMNASVFYDKPKYRLGLKLDNVANERYYSGWTTVEVNMPRRFSGNVTFKF